MEHACQGCQPTLPLVDATLSARNDQCDNLAEDEIIQCLLSDIFTHVESTENPPWSFRFDDPRNWLESTGNQLLVTQAPSHSPDERTTNNNANDNYLGIQSELCKCFEPLRKNDPIKFSIIAGDVSDVALFVRCEYESPRMFQLARRYAEFQRRDSHPSAMDRGEVLKRLSGDSHETTVSFALILLTIMDGRIVLSRLLRKLDVDELNFRPFITSLEALASAYLLYDNLPGATVDLKLMIGQIHEAHWIPQIMKNWDDYWGSTLKSPVALTRSQKFSCIAMFESGHYNLLPSDLDEIFAISSRNRIYVSSLLLRDPFLVDHINNIEAVIGNVGRTGMALMIPPKNPRIKRLPLEHWHIGSHKCFDGNLDNRFEATSLHLSFTEYEMPFDIGNRGSIDTDLCFVETLISVLDRGRWIADLDVLAPFNRLGKKLIHRVGFPKPRGNRKCRRHSKHGQANISEDLISFDDWTAILEAHADIPDGTIGVIRASGQWMARLATACVGLQKGLRTTILPPETSSIPCWICVLKRCNDYWDQISKKGDSEYSSGSGYTCTSEFSDDEDFIRPHIIIC